MRFFFVLAITSFFYLKSAAQVAEAMVQGVAPNNYLVHKVFPKESWYSVGRLYNVNARELANYNKLAVEKGLTIAQVIKVPIMASNKYDAKIALPEGEVTVPIYHLVEKSEGLYRIAINNGATMQQVREWNALTTDILSTGTKLKVGYIRVKQSESALANVKEEVPVPIKEKPTEAIVEKPKDEAKPEPTLPKEKPPVPVIEKEAPKAVVEPKKITVSDNPITNSNASEGFFKTEYTKLKLSNKTMEGKAAIFKTMAGWDDEKFYALIDGVPSGTIMQVTNIQNGKIAYVKVLGEMQELKQNHGLLIRISNATANTLGTNEETFAIQVKY